MRDRRALSQRPEDIACVFVSTCKFHAMSRRVLSLGPQLFPRAFLSALYSVIIVSRAIPPAQVNLLSPTCESRDTRYFVTGRERNSLRTQITTCVAHGIQCACGPDVAANKLSSGFVTDLFYSFRVSAGTRDHLYDCVR